MVALRSRALRPLVTVSALASNPIVSTTVVTATACPDRCGHGVAGSFGLRPGRGPVMVREACAYCSTGMMLLTDVPRWGRPSAV